MITSEWARAISLNLGMLSLGPLKTRPPPEVQDSPPPDLAAQMKQDSMAVVRDKLVDFAQKKEDASAISRDPVGYKRPGGNQHSKLHTPKNECPRFVRS